MKILAILSILIIQTACDRYYTLHFGDDTQKVFETNCGTMIISSNSINKFSFDYHIRIIPKEKIIVSFKGIRVLLDNKEWDFVISYYNKGIIRADSVFVESDTEFVIALKAVEDSQSSRIEIIGDDILISGSESCGFGRLYVPISNYR